MATVLGLSHQTSLGTQPKNSNAATIPSRIASVRSKGSRQHEGGVRVGPSRDQERHEPAAIGEIDVDVAEIGFESFTGKMPQRDERFLIPASVLTQIALHLGIAAAVVVFVAEPPEDLGGGVPLLGWGDFVVDEDLVDDRLNRSQERSESIPGRREGVRLGLLENLYFPRFGSLGR